MDTRCVHAWLILMVFQLLFHVSIRITNTLHLFPAKFDNLQYSSYIHKNNFFLKKILHMQRYKFKCVENFVLKVIYIFVATFYSGIK